MTGSIDLIPRLEAWLAEEDGARLSEGVFDAVIAQAAQVRQVGRRWGWTGTRIRWALAVAGVAAAAVLGIGLYRFVGPPVGTESPSPSASAQATPLASASPTPTPAAYVSSQLGFSAVEPLTGNHWGNFLYAALDTGGEVLTFAAGRNIGGDVWTNFIVVSSGTADLGAPVGVFFPETPRPAPSASPGDPDWAHASYVRVWAKSADELATAFVAAAGGHIVGPTTLGGEPAVTIGTSNEMAQTIVCVHAGRAYVVSTTGFLQHTTAPGWDAFLASFHFID